MTEQLIWWVVKGAGWVIASRMPFEAVLPAVAAALLGFCAWLYPASLTDGGALSACVSASACLTYVALFIRLRHSGSASVARFITAGRRAGIALALAALVAHSFEVFGALPRPWPAILGVGMWGLMFLLLGTAAADTCSREGSFLEGVESSLWAVMISASATVAFALSVGLLFMPRMQRMLGGLPAGVVRTMFDGAMVHVLLGPVVAVAAAMASGVVYSFVKPLRIRTAIALMAGAVVVAAGGISALRFASTLPRSARPPYVMLGLCALGIGLTALPGLLTAVRRRP
jgi:hypothetical protein